MNKDSRSEQASLAGFSSRAIEGDSPSSDEGLVSGLGEQLSPRALQKSLSALNESLADLQAGRTRDFDEVNAEIRKRYCW